MREWRVGTISMGASLVLLGVLLFVSQMKSWDVAKLFISWWPFILIVLGIEILVYLYLSKQDAARIKYDFLSIIFIGVLGTMALGFMFLTVSGIMDEVRYAVHAEEETYDLPPFVQKVPDHIERIVLHVDGQESIRLEGTNDNVFQVFGTYRTSQISDMTPLISKEEDYISVNESDQTLYMKIKQLPGKRGFVHANAQTEMVVLIPSDIELEFNGNRGYQMTSIRPGELKNDWFIEDSGSVNIQLREESNIQVNVDSEEGNRTWTTGEGTYSLRIASFNPNEVNVVVQGKD